jgi:hypothetical protein
MRRSVFAVCLAALLCALPAFAQGVPTGTISGRVTNAEGEALPGVMVTVSSPSLQGTRSATTKESGDYIVPLLPPGEYQVSFEMDGFQTAQRNVKISAAQDSQIDTQLQLSTISDEIVVTGTYETISTGTQTSSTFEKAVVESLPMERNIRETVFLTPGVSDSGPGAPRTRTISISGAMTFENLFLVNGVVVNENLRGQPQNLFIEDAIEETTVSTSGISAEYGRFSGGVVNTVTKSGGNELEGSFRTNFTNNDWESKTPVTTLQTDKINRRYEATLGGWLMKDRLWYFAAGRQFEESRTQQTFVTRIPFLELNDEQRIEGKLTVSPFQGHRLIGSYIDIEREENGARFGNILDTRSLSNRSLPNELRALNYTGVLTDSFFIEAQYSERQFAFVGDGSRTTDRVGGTLLIDDEQFRWNSPTFCGVCRPEERDNENALLKASWFLSSENLGSHDIAFGYDTFEDIRAADNHQSGSDFRIFITDTLVRGTNLFPQLISGNNGTFIQWNPIPVSSLGTSFKTNSFFVNDRWRFNDRLSFNVGARYDVNDGVDSSGKKVTDDSKVSPRLGATYDLRGDGNWIFNASYGQYVAAIANTQADATSSAGNFATYQWFYRGPSINADPNGQLLTAEQALNLIWAWFDAQGGTANTSNLRGPINIPGGTTTFRGALKSPSTEEYTAGVAKRLGNRGLVRAQYVHREGTDFYMERRDLTTGSVLTPTGVRTDLSVVENDSDHLERVYDGLHTQFQYRIGERMNVGGFYVLSRLHGNFDGENRNSGPIRGIELQYPEYKEPEWNSPTVDLGADRRHRARLWAVYDLIQTPHHHLNIGLLQTYTTGLPYGAVGNIDPRPYVQNPGYIRPPATVVYFYTPGDEFRMDDVTSTDLTLNYNFSWGVFGKDVEVYLQPEVLNVFNEHAAINVNTTDVQDSTNRTNLRPFNPFTDRPVEGVNWTRGPRFGKPVNEEDYQAPRTFRFSVGFRF